MLLLHIFLAFSYISVCVFVVFFPCLFSVKNLLNLFIDDYYNIQRYKLYGNMRQRRRRQWQAYGNFRTFAENFRERIFA